MGTRNTITFIKKIDNEELPVVCIYQQYNGYLEGVGKQLCKWLLKKTIINGIGIDQHSLKYANGFGCLAAQFIRDHKSRVGGLYLKSLDYSDEEYNYEIICDYDAAMCVTMNGIPANDLITIRVHCFEEKPFFEGSPRELLDYIENRQGEEE